MRILLVDDEKMTLAALSAILRREGHEVAGAADGHAALAALDGGPFDLVLTDLNLPGPDGLEILTRARADAPEARVIIMTAYASTQTAVEALRLGAYDYVIKPFQTDEVLARVRRIAEHDAVVAENRALRAQIDGAAGRRIVGDSPRMKQLVKTIGAVAPGDYNVLILGPSGTGKELVARAVHDASGRRDGPFVPINCAAIPESLLESELFGYRKGAFTGADRDHQGYIARAHGGTLFIDDIDDMPVNVQVKLLRVIQEREIEPVGGGEAVPVDFRLVSATKEDLKALAAEGRFREDLYYRLNVIPLELPTLAERREDIPALVRHFAAARGRDDFRLSPEVFEALMNHRWPGNVRELENVVERMLALPDVPVAGLFDGPLRRGGGGHSPSAPAGDPSTAARAGAAGQPVDEDIPAYRDYMHRCEQYLLHWALERADGNITEAARLLDLPRSTLRSRLEKN
jgi:DNA-binding NtrC family response regulator